MEPVSPARLYATAVGALLILLGIAGFFYGSSFGSPGTVDHTLGVWGLILDPSDAILSFIPASGANEALNLTLGLLGLLAALGTPRRLRQQVPDSARQAL